MGKYYKSDDEKTSKLTALLLELIHNMETQNPGMSRWYESTEIDGAWYVAKPCSSDVCNDLTDVLDGIEVVELPDEEL